jgi:hypothetical protein
LLLLASALLVAASAQGSTGVTIRSLLEQPGDETALLAGGNDYSVGPIRFSFVFLRKNGQPVDAPTARVWVATGLDAKPFTESVARLEPIGLPGKSEPAEGDVTKIYVTRFIALHTGKLWLVAEPNGGKPIQGVANVIVKAHSFSPAIGSKAIPSQTPTLKSTHGNVAELTTRIPPDYGLLGYSVAGSLAAHKPFVLTFATPKFCSSRTCGPVVDVVEEVARRFERENVRFIHVEVFEDNDPAKGYNRWLKEWDLRTEPWTFVVDGSGTIVERFEGTVSVDELETTVREKLLA